MPKYRVTNQQREKARELRRSLTDAERKLWHLLRWRQLSHLKFRRQVPLGSWIADFVSYEHKIVVEADGGQHVDSEHDQIRDIDLAERNFRVLRFCNNDILTNANGMLERILDAIRTSPSPVSSLRSEPPSPTRGEG
jgi:very-short-patch-repair endonuclease